MIDSTYIHGMELAEVAQRLIGPAGSHVKMHIRRIQPERSTIEFSVTLMRQSIRDYFRPHTNAMRSCVALESLEDYRVMDRGEPAWHAREEGTQSGLESSSEGEKVANLEANGAAGDQDRFQALAEEQEYILNNSYSKSIQDYSTPLVRQVCACANEIMHARHGVCARTSGLSLRNLDCC